MRRVLTHRVLLVRHCESSGQAPGAPLTERGHAQAIALVARLGGFDVDHITSSPYARARETIAPFAARHDLAINVDARLAEVRSRHIPGEDWRDRVRRSFVDLEFVPAGGESGRQAQERGRAALDALLNADCRLPVAVTHGQLMSHLLHSIDPVFGFSQWACLTNPDLYLVERDATGRLSFRRAMHETDE
jgi:2,3-bisphosphoglycerate-dependent phosphoglycerate mutase